MMMNDLGYSRTSRHLVVVMLLFFAGVGTTITPAGAVMQRVRSSHHTSPTVNARALDGKGDIAFVSDGDLYVLDGKTKELREVARGLPVPIDPHFSHDGRWLAFTRSTGDSASSITDTLWIARANGSDAHPVKDIPTVNPVPNAVGPAFSWSPVSDEILVTTGPIVSTPLYPREIWMVSPTGHDKELPITGFIAGVEWSPSGSMIGVIEWPLNNYNPTVETIPTSGGKPTKVLSVGENTIIFAGWSSTLGILIWYDQGNGGPSVTLAGLPLEAIKGESMTPITTALLGGDAMGAHGQLALVQETAPVTFAQHESPKYLWYAKAVETCTSVAACTPVLNVPNEVTLDPAWSSSGALAFDEAPQGTAAPLAGQLAPETWSVLAPWYAEHSLWVLAAGASAPQQISGTSGATDPVWSGNGKAIVYVANNALWLVPSLAAKPIKIAAPLDGSSGDLVFGYTDWTGNFAVALP